VTGGIKDIGIDTVIEVEFDTLIVEGSKITGVTIKSGSTAVKAAVKVEGTLLKVVPEKNLWYNTTYKVTVPAGAIEDSSGNSLASDFSLEFKTRAMPKEMIAFTDLTPNHWAVNQIVYLSGIQVINGYPDKSFRPEEKVTRAQLAVMLARILGLSEAETEEEFMDVGSDHWTFKEIQSMKKIGLIAGFNGRFRPENFVTREEMVVMIMNAVHWKKNSSAAGKEKELKETGSLYGDFDRIPQWAQASVAEATEIGLVHGMGNNDFGVGMNATRAQAAALMYKLAAYLD